MDYFQQLKKNDGTKKYKRKLKNSAILIVVSIVLIIIGVSLPSSDENSGKKETASTHSKTVEKKEKKPVAYTYDKAETKADKKGAFSVNIEVKDGYTPKIINSENVSLKKKDDNNYLLSGTVDKNEQTATYKLIFTASDDKQTKDLTIDNALAKEAYVQKQVEEAEKGKKKKAAAKQKAKETALKNETALSYGMLNKSQDKYLGEPYPHYEGPRYASDGRKRRNYSFS